MELTHIYTQVDRKGADQSQLKITVEYDTEERTWKQLVKVLAIDLKTRSAVDITNIFFECFHDQAEAIIDGINWAEKLPEEKPTTWKMGMHPVFQQVFQPFLK